VVDRVACTGHGICASLLPEAINPDEWGYPVLLAPGVDPEVGDIAIRLCPARALFWTARCTARDSEPAGQERRSPPR